MTHLVLHRFNSATIQEGLRNRKHLPMLALTNNLHREHLVSCDAVFVNQWTISTPSGVSTCKTNSLDKLVS